MNRFWTIPAAIMAALWVAGCGSECKPAASAPQPDQPAAAEPAAPAKPAAKAAGGSTPLVNMQQTMAIDQTVDKAARQTDTKAGRKAQARIDEIGKKRAEAAEEAGL